MPPKDKPNQVKAEPKGQQRAEGEKTAASDEGVNWLKEAWRRAGFTPFNGSTIAAKTAALGLRQSPENCCRYRRNRRLLHYRCRSPRHVPQRVLGKQRLLRLWR